MSAPVVAYAGLTHLGLVYGAAAAATGFRVVAFDADAKLISALTAGRLPVEEPGLETALRSHRDRITFTADPAALAAADVVFISADVPTDDAGRSDLSRTHRLIEIAAARLKPEATLVVLCQVPPGFTRSLGIPKARLFYQVETLVFGRALERALEPERFIVGCDDPSKDLPGPYSAFLQASGCPVLRMRYESAELTKIAINCCLVASVSVANTLAELCEKISADWSEIAPALRLDRRIGPHAYLAPGLGIAGGNLERDLATVVRFAEERGTDSGVVRAWMENSRHRRNWAARMICETLIDKDPRAPIAVWGLAYKENTHSTKNSPSLATLQQIPEARVRVHDPVVPASEARHAHAVGVAEPLGALSGAEALMILTPWPEYRRIAASDIARAMRGRLVIDPYSVLDPKAAVHAGLDHYSLGRPPQRASSSHA